jgi:C_GCAxxG_C_C family probable redox protein
MDRTDIALDGFSKHFNCAQMVFSSFAEELGLKEETAKKIACGFGGGVSHTGHMCGAVTGAIMVIGLKYGKSDPEDETSKDKTFSLVKEFIDKFSELHGSLYCKDLLGLDMSKPEEFAEIQRTRRNKEICPRFIKSSVEILEEIL